MSSSRRRLPLLAAIAAILAPALLQSAAAQSFPPIWSQWLAALQAQGYGVTQGNIIINSPTYCAQVLQPLFHSCFESNPAGNYLQPQPPVGAGYLDPQYGVKSAATLSNGAKADQFFQLGASEAMLTIINLPPQAAYFSLQTYDFTRPQSRYNGKGGTASPDATRRLLSASYGNSVDYNFIHAVNGLNWGGGTIAIITTANAYTVINMSNIFASIGGNTNTILTDGIGANVNYGLGSTQDDLTTIIRYTLPADATAGTNWINAAAQNVAVYRIDPPANESVALFPVLPITAKQYNQNESSHKATLNELSNLLLNWLTAQHLDANPKIHTATPTETVNAQGVVTAGNYGPICITNGTDCTADEQDNDAYKQINAGTLSANGIIIAAGVNHAATNNATYTNIGLSTIAGDTGIVAANQTSQSAAGFSAGTLNNSAAEALIDLGLYNSASPALINDLPNLYVTFFTRPCNNINYCPQPFTTIVPNSAVTTSQSIRLIERAYVLPGLFNGANPTDLLNPSVIF